MNKITVSLNSGHMIFYPDTMKPVPSETPFVVDRTSFWLKRVKSGALKIVHDGYLGSNSKADINQDGVVDERDLSEVHKAYHDEKKKDKNSKKGKE